MASYRKLTSLHGPGMLPAGHPHRLLRNGGNVRWVLAALLLNSGNVGRSGKKVVVFQVASCSPNSYLYASRAIVHVTLAPSADSVTRNIRNAPYSAQNLFESPTFGQVGSRIRPPMRNRAHGQCCIEMSHSHPDLAPKSAHRRDSADGPKRCP